MGKLSMLHWVGVWDFSWGGVLRAGGQPSMTPTLVPCPSCRQPDMPSMCRFSLMGYRTRGPGGGTFAWLIIPAAPDLAPRAARGLWERLPCHV